MNDKLFYHCSGMCCLIQLSPYSVLKVPAICFCLPVSSAELIAAVSLAAGATAVGILAYQTFASRKTCPKPKVNLELQKDNPKVVHAFDIEDLGDKAVYCRCWRSKKVACC